MRRVNPRARTREDRAGDPLDGLVNLFDLGIVLSVAFLLAALSSLDLTSALFDDQAQAGKAPEGSVVVQPGEKARSIDLQPGARVVGQGEPVGTVYRLEDGRTIIVEPEGSGGNSSRTAPNSTPDTQTSPDRTIPDALQPDSKNPAEPTLGAPDTSTDSGTDTTPSDTQP